MGRRGEDEGLLDGGQLLGAVRQTQDAQRIDADGVELALAERLLGLGEEDADLGAARGRLERRGVEQGREEGYARSDHEVERTGNARSSGAAFLASY